MGSLQVSFIPWLKPLVMPLFTVEGKAHINYGINQFKCFTYTIYKITDCNSGVVKYPFETSVK